MPVSRQRYEWLLDLSSYWVPLQNKCKYILLIYLIVIVDLHNFVFHIENDCKNVPLPSFQGVSCCKCSLLVSLNFQTERKVENRRYTELKDDTDKLQ